ncbi:MAG: hypothetical protein IJ733_07075 [Lachnospiraceae bacterium]|nr:hypothetical protein [Lachnospiraceae bacterium]
MKKYKMSAILLACACLVGCGITENDSASSVESEVSDSIRTQKSENVTEQETHDTSEIREKNAVNGEILSDGRVDEGDGIRYFFSEDRMSIKIPDSYDVYRMEYPETDEETLRHLEITQDQLTRYLQTSNYEIQAYPKGQRIDDSNREIEVNVKKDKYNEIGELKDLSEKDKKNLADALVSSFSGTDGYEWLETGEFEFIGFDTKMLSFQRRYATITGGDMIYIIWNDDKKIEEDDKRFFETIVQSFSKEKKIAESESSGSGKELSALAESDFYFSAAKGLGENLTQEEIQYGYYYGFNKDVLKYQNLFGGEALKTSEFTSYVFPRKTQIGMNLQSFIENYAVDETNAVLQSWVGYSMFYGFSLKDLDAIGRKSQWLDLDIAWYQNDQNQWIRMSAEQVKDLFCNTFNTECKAVYSISVDAKSESGIQEIFYMYGSLEDFTKYNQ